MTEVLNAPAADAATAARISKFSFQTVDEKCIGCGHIRQIDGIGYCNSYANPSSKWTAGMCNFATHAKIERKVEKISLNPLKASKRGGK
jgi:hypothetical protein